MSYPGFRVEGLKIRVSQSGQPYRILGIDDDKCG